MKLSTSLLTHLGAVAISVTTTALDRVSGVRCVCCDACVPGFGCGGVVCTLARESVLGGVGVEVFREVRVSVAHSHAMGQSS